MAKANRAFTGSRQGVGTPTLSRNNYFILVKTIRKAMENQSASIKTARTEVQPVAKDS